MEEVESKVCADEGKPNKQLNEDKKFAVVVQVQEKFPEVPVARIQELGDFCGYNFGLIVEQLEAEEDRLNSPQKRAVPAAVAPVPETNHNPPLYSGNHPAESGARAPAQHHKHSNKGLSGEQNQKKTGLYPSLDSAVEVGAGGKNHKKKEGQVPRKEKKTYENTEGCECLLL